MDFFSDVFWWSLEVTGKDAEDRKSVRRDKFMDRRESRKDSDSDGEFFKARSSSGKTRPRHDDDEDLDSYGRIKGLK